MEWSRSNAYGGMFMVIFGWCFVSVLVPVLLTVLLGLGGWIVSGLDS